MPAAVRSRRRIVPEGRTRRWQLDALAEAPQLAEPVGTATATPPVLVVLVVHDGAAWLAHTLDALEAQTYAPLRVVAVDNASTDGSRDVLLERLDPDDVVIADRDLGFGVAVSLGVDAARAGDHEWILLLHDDVAPAPDAVEHLVAHAASDPRLAVVGPKLVSWEDPRRLQAVGMSVDVTGRADSGLEQDELDQGQRDRPGRALYVPTAAMLVRRDAFERIGRFDPRYHVFRDDLDLCWRAWLAGYEVEVVPAAVARHASAAANYQRQGHTAFLGPRYFAERNTLATLLKSYGALRLAAVLPLFFAVGVAKVLGFLATRRLSDAWQTVRAWAWNALHLPHTLRLRRRTQRLRQRSDAELRPLFIRVVPRLRAYAEAVAEWLAGGDLDLAEQPPDEVPEPGSVTRRAITFVRRHPASVSAATLAVLGVVVAFPLLRAGMLRGGDLAAFPASPTTFLRDYLAAWHDAAALGTSAPPSPAQPALGVLGLLSLGSGWLAQRVLLFAPFPIAWLLSLRAARLVSSALVPRVAAATAYVLSPPAVAALAAGRVRTLAVLVGLPAVLATVADAARPAAPSGRGWRAAAAAGLLGAAVIAFEPAFALVFLLVVGAFALASLVTQPPGVPRNGVLLRLGIATAGAFVVLLPWSLQLVDPATYALGGGPAGTVTAPLWRWLLLVPPAAGFPPLVAGAGLVAAAVLGLAFGFAQRPRVTAGLWVVALGAVAGAYLLDRVMVGALWPGNLLLLAAGGYAALLGVAFASAAAQLGHEAFGRWQLLAGLTAVALAAAVLGSTAHLLRNPWSELLVDAPALPAFVAAEAAEVGPFRVLVLAVDDQGAWDWDVVGAEGPSMLRFGVQPPVELVSLVGRAVQEISLGTNPGAASQLGIANVRYVLVPEGGSSDALQRALGGQIGLDPQPVGAGLLYRVSDWLPRAAHVPSSAAGLLLRRGELPPGTPVSPLVPGARPGEYLGSVPGPGVILVAEAAQRGWQGVADDRVLAADPAEGLARFAVQQAADEVRVTFTGQARRRALVGVQLLALFLLVSVLLRPPGFTERT